MLGLHLSFYFHTLAIRSSIFVGTHVFDGGIDGMGVGRYC
jgi:hypothetical protein